MDVHRRGAVDAVEPFEARREVRGRNRAQAVRRRTQPEAGIAGGARAQCPHQAQECVGLEDEAALDGVRRRAVEALAAVEHRQKGEADAGLPRGVHDRRRHLRRVVVGAPGRVEMKVMEFADRGVAGLEHLDVEPGGDGAHVVRRKTRDEPVHDLAPAPEAVLRRAGTFGEPGHGPLEGVAMQIGHTRKHGAGDAFRTAPIGVRRNRIERAVRAHRHADVRRPARREQRGIGKVKGHGHSTAFRKSARQGPRPALM